MNATISAGIDLGHSAVKVVWRKELLDGHIQCERFQFPTAATPAKQYLGQDEQRSAAAETISINGRNFFIGETALKHGRSGSFLTDDWISSPEYAALLAGSIRRVEAEVGFAFGRRVLVLGLPARLERLQRPALVQMASRLCPGWSIYVLPQSKAPILAHLQDDSGLVAADRNIAEECWGVLDIGRYTVDAGALLGGTWSASVSSSDIGTKAAEDHVIESLMGNRGIALSQGGAQAALSTGAILQNCRLLDVRAEVEVALDVLRQSVVEYARRVFAPFNEQIQGIVLAGGGATLVEAAIRQHWENVIVPAEPRFAIADGMSRFGMFAAALQSAAGATS